MSDESKKLGKAPHHEEQGDEVEAHKRAAHDEQQDEASSDDEVEAHNKKPYKQA